MIGYGLETKQSPYMDRRDRIFGRPNGRPTGSTDSVQGRASTGQPAPFQPVGTNTGGGTGSGISQSMQQSPYASFLSGLAKPIGYESQFQQRFNVARGQIQGAGKIEMETAKKYLGGKGFRGGESGYADSPLASIARGTGERLTRATQQIGIDEATRKAEYDRMNLQRQTAGAGIALQGEEGALNRQFGYYRSKLDAETTQWQPWWQGMAQGYGG